MLFSLKYHISKLSDSRPIKCLIVSERYQGRTFRKKCEYLFLFFSNLSIVMRELKIWSNSTQLF